MNKRDRQQLKASIAKDLIQGQGDTFRNQGACSSNMLPWKESSPRRTQIIRPAAQCLWKTPGTTCHRGTECAFSMARCHGGTCCYRGTDATVARFAMVKGNCGYRIRSISASFRRSIRSQKPSTTSSFCCRMASGRDTCMVGLSKLAKSVLMSQRKVQNTIIYLEKRGLIKRLRIESRRTKKGNFYQVLIPNAADTASRCHRGR